MVPVAIAECSDIGPAAKMVYIVVANDIRKNKTSQLGHRVIADVTCCGVNTVTRALAKIEALGFLRVKHGLNGRKNTYRLGKLPVPKMGTPQNGDTPKWGRNRPQNGGATVPKMGTKYREEKRRVSKDTPPKKKRTPEEAAKYRALKDAVAAEFYPSGVPRSEGPAFGKIVADYVSVGATPAEIQLRVKRYREGWPSAACTARALVKHWDQFSEDVSKRATDPSRVRAKAGAADKYEVHRP